MPEIRKKFNLEAVMGVRTGGKRAFDPPENWD